MDIEKYTRKILKRYNLIINKDIVMVSGVIILFMLYLVLYKFDILISSIYLGYLLVTITLIFIGAKIHDREFINSDNYYNFILYLILPYTLILHILSYLFKIDEKLLKGDKLKYFKLKKLKRKCKNNKLKFWKN